MYSKPNTTVMGQKVPPPGRPRRLDAAPTPLDNTTATPIGKATTPALLHSAYARVGRAVLCLCLAALPFLASCEKEAQYEGFPEMHSYYQESCGLGSDAVDIDSITRFTSKVNTFVEVNPEAKETSYYPLIKENVKKYWNIIIIRIEGEGEWDGIDNIDDLL